MEARETSIDGKGWTEERHAAFLNWMEESFVHRMLGPSGGGKEAAANELVWPGTGRECDHHHLPLDRHIPDSATESTGDSRARPRPSWLLTESGNNRDLVVVANTNRNRMTKRLLSQLDHAPLDQVVPLPQLGSVVDISIKKKKKIRLGEIHRDAEENCQQRGKSCFGLGGRFRRC